MLTHLINNDEDKPVLQHATTISDNSSDDKSEDEEEDKGNSENEAAIIETAAIEDDDGPEINPSSETTINEKGTQAIRNLDTPLANNIVKEASE